MDQLKQNEIYEFPLQLQRFDTGNVASVDNGLWPLFEVYPINNDTAVFAGTCVNRGGKVGYYAAVGTVTPGSYVLGNVYSVLAIATVNAVSGAAPLGKFRVISDDAWNALYGATYLPVNVAQIARGTAAASQLGFAAANGYELTPGALASIRTGLATRFTSSDASVVWASPTRGLSVGGVGSITTPILAAIASSQVVSVTIGSISIAVSLVPTLSSDNIISIWGAPTRTLSAEGVGSIRSGLATANYTFTPSDASLVWQTATKWLSSDQIATIRSGLATANQPFTPSDASIVWANPTKWLSADQIATIRAGLATSSSGYTFTPSDASVVWNSATRWLSSDQVSTIRANVATSSSGYTFTPSDASLVWQNATRTVDLTSGALASVIAPMASIVASGGTSDTSSITNRLNQIYGSGDILFDYRLTTPPGTYGLPGAKVWVTNDYLASPNILNYGPQITDVNGYTTWLLAEGTYRFYAEHPEYIFSTADIEYVASSTAATRRS